jgi:voltage-gated potassium channel
MDASAMSALGNIVGGMLGAPSGGASYQAVKNGLRDLATRDPVDSLLATVLGGAWLFWQAERDANSRCRTYWDALVFVSTSLSVGYDSKFAATPSGKAIATFLMTFGPAMTARALHPPAAQAHVASHESLEVQRGVLLKLDAILEELKRR